MSKVVLASDRKSKPTIRESTPESELIRSGDLILGRVCVLRSEPLTGRALVYSRQRVCASTPRRRGTHRYQRLLLCWRRAIELTFAHHGNRELGIRDGRRGRLPISQVTQPSLQPISRTVAPLNMPFGSAPRRESDAKGLLE